MPRTTVYAVREVATSRRISYRYRSLADAKEALASIQYSLGQRKDTTAVEIYKTTQDLPRR